MANSRHRLEHCCLIGSPPTLGGSLRLSSLKFKEKVVSSLITWATRPGFRGHIGEPRRRTCPSPWEVPRGRAALQTRSANRRDWPPARGTREAPRVAQSHGSAQHAGHAGCRCDYCSRLRLGGCPLQTHPSSPASRSHSSRKHAGGEATATQPHLPPLRKAAGHPGTPWLLRTTLGRQLALSSPGPAVAEPPPQSWPQFPHWGMVGSSLSWVQGSCWDKAPLGPAAGVGVSGCAAGGQRWRGGACAGERQSSTGSSAASGAKGQLRPFRLVMRKVQPPSLRRPRSGEPAPPDK